jgi:hypothetical protein
VHSAKLVLVMHRRAVVGHHVHAADPRWPHELRHTCVWRRPAVGSQIDTDLRFATLYRSSLTHVRRWLASSREPECPWEPVVRSGGETTSVNARPGVHSGTHQTFRLPSSTAMELPSRSGDWSGTPETGSSCSGRSGSSDCYGSVAMWYRAGSEPTRGILQHLGRVRASLRSLTGRWVPHDTRDAVIDFVRVQELACNEQRRATCKSRASDRDRVVPSCEMLAYDWCRI